MAQPLPQLFETLTVDEPQAAGPLQVFGLRRADGGLEYATLDEALAARSLEVTEVNEGGSVPTLRVVNRGDALVFLMAGEHLVGAKQNRVLNASILVAARSELPVPVSCVEAGRWGYRSRQFASGGSASHGQLRRLMSKQAQASYRAGGTPRSDQGAVWSEVSRKLGAMESASPSQALEQAYADHRQRLDDVLAQCAAPAGCSGAVFAFAGRVAGVDLFDRPETLAKLWPKLVRAYAIDALEQAATPAGAVTRETVAGWLRSAARATAEPFKSPGLGYDVRLQGADLVGAGLVVDDHPLHVELFPDGPGGGTP